MSTKKVPGKNRKHRVKLYTISTCGWCRKMKRLLKSLDIEHEYVDIDLLSGEEEERVRRELAKFSPKILTPTLVVDDGKEVIVGFEEEKVRRCFKNGE